jgi:hypothetical protein
VLEHCSAYAIAILKALESLARENPEEVVAAAVAHSLRERVRLHFSVAGSAGPTSMPS